MGLHLGETALSNFRSGDVAAKAAYLGETQVWPVGSTTVGTNTTQLMTANQPVSGQQFFSNFNGLTPT